MNDPIVDPAPPTNEVGVPCQGRLRRFFVLALWLGSFLIGGGILALSWAADSRMAMLPWIPGWLAGWADSGGAMQALRTAVPMVMAGILFTLAWRVSGWRHWILGGIGLALGLLLVAELG